ncbi:MAG: DUF3426 domain-containing protein [Proteobacteria bacterium]|nr:MAG: DUF3426 domain-containing protein [Pseudomonadota bacterium]
MSLTVGVLLAALAAQLTLTYRQSVIGLLPATRPFIEALCANVGCSLDLPRDASQIGIEASDLNRLPDADALFELTATLRNRADTAMAFPHLELTLTDMQDKALVRRVFPPQEWLGSAADDAAGFTAHSDRMARVAFSAEGVNASGYRLYAFYP